METDKLIGLVARAKKGDADAMETLYLDAYISVYRFALRMVRNAEDAEDLTQEAFMTAHEKIKELREPAAFYAWVNQITANKCNELLRKNRGVVWLKDEEELLTYADDDPMNLPDKALDDEATRKIILDVIDNLPDIQRVCVLLFYYAQFTVKQIAETLETNENTVKTRLSYARAKIRAALEEKAEKEGIKLWGIPLALTPILREAMEQMPVPDGLGVRMWESIKNAAPNLDGTSGQVDPKSGTGSTASANSAAIMATGTAAKTGMSLATKIVIGIIAAVLIMAGAIFIPRLLETPPEEMTPPAVTDAATVATNDTEGQETETTTPDDTAVFNTSNSVVGDIITFGIYNGEPIEWRVLEIADDKTLIIAEKILAKRMYYGYFADANGDGKVDWGGDEFDAAGGAEAFACTWEESDIRNWLNDEFYLSAFSSNEQGKVMQSVVSTFDIPGWGPPDGYETSDKLFLLSTDEAISYFQHYDTQAIYDSEEYPSEWWLRSPGSGRNAAAIVVSNGHINDNGDVVMNTFGVRPALWLETPGTTQTATD